MKKRFNKKNRFRRRRRRIKNYVIAAVVVIVGFIVAVFSSLILSSPTSRLIIAASSCPSFGTTPIFYSREAARKCLHISDQFLERVESSFRKTNDTVKARELLDGTNLFSPRHDKHLNHLGDSYDERLPQKPPNKAHEINITIHNILHNSSKRVIQAASPLQNFSVTFMKDFETSRKNCDAQDSFALSSAMDFLVE